MSTPQQSNCRVVHAEKLPADVGGADAICAAIAKAMTEKAPNVRYTAEVEIRSKSGLIASVTAEGKAPVKRQLAVMDKNLNPASIQRFAEALATEIAKL